MWRLDQACSAIREAVGVAPYLVGSVLERPDPRDVDVRLILPDDQWEALEAFGSEFRILLGLVFSEWLSARSGLAIDFQIQAQTSANVHHGETARNPVGTRSLANFTGDWDTPHTARNEGSTP